MVFGIPRAMSSVEQYGFGSDVPNLDRHGFIYRKDWADKLGIETSDIMTYDDLAKRLENIITSLKSKL